MIGHFERLEDRVLLAASIKLKNGTLTINGDGGDNNVAVAQFGDDIVVRVDVDGDGVFGGAGDLDETFDQTVAEEMIDNIKINTKGGDDCVLVFEIGPSTLSGDLKITTGGGDDAVGVIYSYIGDDLSVNTGGGNDCVIGVFVSGGDAKVTTGGGDDIVNIEDSAVGGKASIKTGGGNDGVGIDGIEIDGKVDVNLGGGNDVLGIDVASVTVGPEAGPVKVNGGGGGDLLVSTDGGAEAALEGLGADVKGFESDVDFDDLAGDELTRVMELQDDLDDCEDKLDAVFFAAFGP